MLLVTHAVTMQNKHAKMIGVSKSAIISCRHVRGPSREACARAY